jgi:hypothetical protein
MRHTNVSQDPRYHHWGLAADDGDAECTTAPRRVPDWVISPEETEGMFQARHSTTPDLIYARGVPDSPPRPDLFRQEQCIIIIVEIGHCKEFGSDVKLEEKAEKYTPPLITAIRKY